MQVKNVNMPKALDHMLRMHPALIQHLRWKKGSISKNQHHDSHHMMTHSTVIYPRNRKPLRNKRSLIEEGCLDMQYVQRKRKSLSRRIKSMQSTKKQQQKNTCGLIKSFFQAKVGDLCNVHKRLNINCQSGI